MALHRRSFFALSALGAGALPALGAQAQPSAQAQAQKDLPPVPTDLSQQIAAYVVKTGYDSLSAKAREATRRSILDAVGVTLAASGLEPACSPFVGLAMAEGGLKQATILGRGLKASAANAAMANGSFAHALDYEDTHDPSGSHPNAAVVPTALAVAQALGGVSGKDFVTAVAIGCDLTCRIALGRTENLNKFGWYFPPIASAFGATATAAKLMGLNERQVLDALSLTLCQTSVSSELINNEETTVRAIRDAFPSQVAVRSAYLAKAGVRGFDHPFEGENGFITMYSHGRYNAKAITDGLGQHFLGEDISYKAWPACRGTHIYIQAILEMMNAEAIAPDDVGSIACSISQLNTMLCDAPTKKAPLTAIDAKFSIPFTIGTALVHRNVTLSSFSDEAMRHPEVLKVAARVSHRVNEPVARPVAEGGGEFMTLTGKNGKVRPMRIQHMYGSPKMPMPDKDFMQKFTDCAGHAMRAPAAAESSRIADQILTLDGLDDMRKLRVLRT